MMMMNDDLYLNIICMVIKADELQFNLWSRWKIKENDAYTIERK